VKVVWLHSALKDYENCPRKYHEVGVLKNFMDFCSGWGVPSSIREKGGLKFLYARARR